LTHLANILTIRVPSHFMLAFQALKLVIEAGHQSSDDASCAAPREAETID
jgi:hypothetical protein